MTYFILKSINFLLRLMFFPAKTGYTYLQFNHLYCGYFNWTKSTIKPQSLGIQTIVFKDINNFLGVILNSGIKFTGVVSYLVQRKWKNITKVTMTWEKNDHTYTAVCVTFIKMIWTCGRINIITTFWNIYHNSQEKIEAYYSHGRSHILKILIHTWVHVRFADASQLP